MNALKAHLAVIRTVRILKETTLVIVSQDISLVVTPTLVLVSNMCTHRTLCTQDTLYTGHSVHRSFCTKVTLYTGHSVHRSLCTHKSLCTYVHTYMDYYVCTYTGYSVHILYVTLYMYVHTVHR